MNVLITCIEYPPDIHNSGLGTHTRLLAEGLARKGHRVIVLSCDQCSTHVVERNGVTVIFHDVRERISLEKPHLECVRRLCADIASHSGPILAARDFQPTVVHSQGSQLLPAAVAMKRRYRCPLIGTAHICHRRMARMHGRPFDPGLEALERALFKLPTRLIVVSNALREVIRREYDIPDCKMRVVHNGVDAEAAAGLIKLASLQKLRRRLCPNGERAVVFLGSISAGKGILALIESARQVLASGIPAKYLVAGRSHGPIGAEIKKTIQSDRLLQSSVVWMRKLHHRNAMRLLALSDLLVAPSGFEACPYVALEAMSLGVPVIATAVGGFPELIEDGVSGFLAPVSGDEPPVVDTGTLARFQRELLTDETKRRAFARTSRDRAMQQFSLDLMLKGTISCYEEAIEVSRLPRCPAMKSAIYLKR